MLSAVRCLVASNLSLCRVVLAVLLLTRPMTALRARHGSGGEELGCQGPREAEAAGPRSVLRNHYNALLMYVNSIYTARLPTKSL